MLWAFAETVRAHSLEQPTVLMWEDLHWIDSLSLHLLEMLLLLAGQVPLLLLLAFRPEGEWMPAFHQRAMEIHGAVSQT